MPRTKKVIKVVEETTYEFVNASDLLGRPEIMFLELEDEKVAKVLPGKSVFLTQNVIDRYVADGDARFTEGRLRRKDAGKLGDLTEAKDDMSEAEIQVMVRDTEDSAEFTEKVKNINGIPTLKTFLHFLEKYDKPHSFYKTCQDKLQRLEQERLDAMNPTMIPADERAAEVQKKMMNQS